ncbi:transglutaminase domain-containing protein [Candidatus Woesearchaeota archaeon]|nr:transglutaminase domain-containing protein [Candidatus Woesearchaeota archaeon]
MTHENDFPELEDSKRQKFFKILMGVILGLLIVLMVIPYYAVKLDPSPSVIPSPEQVLSSNTIIPEVNVSSRVDYRTLIKPVEPQVKFLADSIVSKACNSGEKICHAKALYYYVRDNTDYVSDPISAEYVEHPLEVAVSQAADCESGAILLAALMESIGVDAQLVFIPQHAFVRIKLDDASQRYVQPDGWIYLDWTCKSCSFSEVPNNNIEKIYLEV